MRTLTDEQIQNAELAAVKGHALSDANGGDYSDRKRSYWRAAAEYLQYPSEPIPEFTDEELRAACLTLKYAVGGSFNLTYCARILREAVRRRNEAAQCKAEPKEDPRMEVIRNLGFAKDRGSYYSLVDEEITYLLAALDAAKEAR